MPVVEVEESSQTKEDSPVKDRRSGPTKAADLLKVEETPSIATVEPVASAPVHRWQYKKGTEIGELTHKFAAISVREERETHVPIDNQTIYIIEWRFDGSSYPVAKVPSVVASILRNMADSKRKYSEI